VLIKEFGFEACYTRYRIENSEKVIEIFKKLGLSGANVTVPHKEWAYKNVMK